MDSVFFNFFLTHIPASVLKVDIVFLVCSSFETQTCFCFVFSDGQFDFSSTI